MAADLNHIIIPAKDRRASACFLADILGLEVGPDFGPFAPVRTGNGVTLDFADSQDFRSHHCAFQVTEAEFDAALVRVEGAGVAFFAQYDGAGPGQINHFNAGRGFYFHDSNGHLFELLTQAHGS